MNGPMDINERTVPIPIVPPKKNPPIKNTASRHILTHLYSTLVLSTIMNGTMSFGATPKLLADKTENPTAIIKHPNTTNNIFTNKL